MYLVSYETFLSYLLKQEEFKWQDEKEISIKLNLYNKAFSLTKCSNQLRLKLNLPLGSYYIEKLDLKDEICLSKYSHDEKFSLAIQVTKEEISKYEIPLTAIYDLTNLKQNFWQRKLENILLLKVLNENRLNLLSDKQKRIYEKQIKNNKYTLEYQNDGLIKLQDVHDENKENDTYYLIDSYEEELKDYLLYLKAYSKGVYEIKELPQIGSHKLKNIFQEIKNNLKLGSENMLKEERYFVDYNTFIKFHRDLVMYEAKYQNVESDTLYNDIDFKRLAELCFEKEDNGFNYYSVIKPPLNHSQNSWDEEIGRFQKRGSRLCFEIEEDEIKYFPYANLTILKQKENFQYLESPKELYLLNHPSKVNADKNYLNIYLKAAINGLYYHLETIKDSNNEYQITAVYKPSETLKEDLVVKINSQDIKYLNNEDVMYFKINNNRNFERGELKENNRGKRRILRRK